MNREAVISQLVRDVQEAKRSGCPFDIWFRMSGLGWDEEAMLDVWMDVHPCGLTDAETPRTIRMAKEREIHHEEMMRRLEIRIRTVELPR